MAVGGGAVVGLLEEVDTDEGVRHETEVSRKSYKFVLPLFFIIIIVVIIAILRISFTLGYAGTEGRPRTLLLKNRGY